MSLELADARWLDGDSEGLLGQVASTSGYSDLIAAAETPALKKFFRDGATEDVDAVRGELDAMSGEKDVVETARGLSKMMTGLDFAMIVNGADGDAVEKEGPTVGDVHVDRPIGAVNGPPKKKKLKGGAETDHHEDGTDILDDDWKPEDQVDDKGRLRKADKITVDVPLFIRLLEVAREEIEEDEPLHVLTERITELLQGRSELTMEDYDDIVASIKKRAAADEPEAEAGAAGSEAGSVSESAVAKRISGNSPIPLNQEGHELADKLGERIALKGGLDVLYSSVLKRGVQTADAIAEHAAPGMKRARTDKLCPWHLGEFEGKEPEDVRDEIDHYIEHPEQVPPGKGADGETAESFDAAKSRQLSFLSELYLDFLDDPTMKLGAVMHSRGMELLQSWVDAGMPEDYGLDLDDLEHPGDPEHAAVLRWHKGEVKEVDLESDDPLKPGVYLILHSLTDDDTDSGNEQLEKGGPGSGRYPAGSGAKDSHESLMASHEQIFDSPVRLGHGVSGEISSTATNEEIQNYKGMLHDHLAEINAHGKVYGMPAAAKTHLAQASNYLMTRGNTVSGREGALMSMHNAIRAIGHVVGGRELASKADHREAGKEAIQMKYLPPLEVHRAAKSAHAQGTSVADITAPLAEQEGLDEEHVRKIAEFFASAEAAAVAPMVVDAWGGKDAAKWAGRVIKKIERDQVQKAGNGVMLAFWPDAETQSKIAVEGGEKPEDIHITLAYFGKLGEVSMDSLPALERAVEQFASTHAPVQVTLGGIGRFPASPQSDGQDVAYLGVHSDGIQEFRQELVDACEAAGVEPKKNFGYNPHVTLKTVAPHAPHLIPTPEPMGVTFDRIVLSIGTACKEYVLAGAAVEKRDGQFEIEGDIVKVDKAQHLVFGWFSVVSIAGKPLVDTQGDVITPETLEASAYHFVLHARAAGAMHESDKDGEVKGIGRLVESVVFTKEKQEAMLQSLKDQGIDAELNLGCDAWWGGFFVESTEVWDQVTSGHLKAFSIGGRGARRKVSE